MTRLAGRVALITGAAGGIGRATAALFAEEGAQVIASDLEPARLAALPAALRLALDVTREEDWAAAVADTESRFGHLDLLVNNAGLALTKGLEETTLEDWRRVLAVNLDGVFLGTRAAIGAMRRRPAERPGEAVIVNLSSVAGIVGAPMLAAYSAAKGGVRLFTKSAALYCAERGYRIRINSLHPGFTETEMLDGIAAGLGEAEEIKRKMARRQPLQRLAAPEEVARAVLFLSCEDSGYMTGGELVFDGGFSAQ